MEFDKVLGILLICLAVIIFLGVVKVILITIREVQTKKAITHLINKGYSVNFHSKHIFKNKLGEYAIYHFDKNGDMLINDEEYHANSDTCIESFRKAIGGNL